MGYNGFALDSEVAAQYIGTTCSDIKHHVILRLPGYWALHKEEDYFTETGN
jgi:hypothetical protein